jgi:hypothetical protein
LPASIGFEINCFMTVTLMRDAGLVSGRKYNLGSLFRLQMLRSY